MSTQVCTIGFTKSTAEHFFERLLHADVKKIIDVRLNNTSQLAGFAKATDLNYLLSKIGHIQYVHEPLLAPTQDILDDYKKKKGSWQTYEHRFKDLVASRKIESKFTPASFADGCLLCSEDKPHYCHRRLVCEYLNNKWNGALSVKHL